jgi:hypothetical protein
MEVVICSQDNNSVLNIGTSSRQLTTNIISEPTLVHCDEGTPLEGQKKHWFHVTDLACAVILAYLVLNHSLINFFAFPKKKIHIF